ncbi:unnamed protein product [Orchesella dallaii]|uniref:Amine oxidase n=1 Tax=Orchesella dallaii TaxID=48710 RepID=A0ABP1QTQ9_9HEXA
MRLGLRFDLNCFKRVTQVLQLQLGDKKTNNHFSSYHYTGDKKIMKKVIVIGGGVAGLTAGKHLVDSGKFEVKLLEGNSRVGGRVHTQALGDHFIENGAQWVHGEDGNEIFKIANSLKLLDTEKNNIKFSSDSVFVTESGKVLDKPVHDNVTIILGKILDGPEDNEVEGSVGDWAIKRFNEALDSYPLEKSLSASVLDWIHRFEDNIDGSDNWFQSSLRGQHEYEECEGNPTIAWEPPASYSSLLGVILNGTPTEAPNFQPELPDWIELNKEVQNIEVLDEEATGIRITCSDGSQHTCDHAICTFSLGVLKHFHKSLFSPQLSDIKQKTIENLGIGCVNKLHFDFKTKWWPDSIIGFNFLWNDTDPVAQYWRSDIDDETLRKDIDGFPLWCRNILGFYVVASHPTALNSWITGPASKLIETLTDEEVKDIFMKVCRKFLPNYDIPDPVEFCRTSWFSNRFTKGSYSFRQMKSEENNVWSSELASPILGKNGIPVLCFAGEATHDHFYSTVHGAYESGVREATRLIDLENATAN